MAVFVSPGVYTRELDLSQYAPQLATSILGIVGGANKGTLDEAILITNESDLINEFGEPSSDSFLIYCGIQYLKQGRSLRVVRVADGTQVAASVDIDGVDQPAYHVCSPDLSRGVDLSTLTTINISTSTLTKEIDLTTGWAGDMTEVSLAHIISRLNDVADGIPGIATKDNTNSKIVLHTTDAGSTKYILIDDTSSPEVNASPVVFGISNYPTSYDGLDTISPALTVSANSPGTWSNGYGIQISSGTESGTFKISVYDSSGNLLESIDNLTMSIIENEVNNSSKFITVDDHDQNVPPDPFLFYTANPSSKRYYLSGGLSGISSLSDADYIGTYTNGVPSGLKIFANPERVDLNMLACPGVSSGAVILEMLSLCQARADCMAIIDPPLGLSDEDVVDWHNGEGTWADLHPAFNSSYGAVYWPWLEYYDAYNEQRIFIPPSCYVAAQYAYNDFIGDIWSAPAGLTRGKISNALRIELNADQGQRDELYSNGNAVNPICDFPSEGIVIWGQRTLQRTPSALDRVNVRRMLCYIEKIVATASRQVVFEANNERTWNRLKNLIEPVLMNVKARGGLEDYSVVIDSSTTTNYEKNRNVLAGKIYLIPTKTAEIIQLDFVVLPSGASFTEK